MCEVGARRSAFSHHKAPPELWWLGVRQNAELSPAGLRRAGGQSWARRVRPLLAGAKVATTRRAAAGAAPAAGAPLPPPAAAAAAAAAAVPGRAGPPRCLRANTRQAQQRVRGTPCGGELPVPAEGLQVGGSRTDLMPCGRRRQHRAARARPWRPAAAAAAAAAAPSTPACPPGPPSAAAAHTRVQVWARTHSVTHKRGNTAGQEVCQTRLTSGWTEFQCSSACSSVMLPPGALPVTCAPAVCGCSNAHCMLAEGAPGCCPWWWPAAGGGTTSMMGACWCCCCGECVGGGTGTAAR